MKWSSCQIPHSCQSRSRRQQVMPEPHPISCGSISQGIPLRRTNTMPVRHCPVCYARSSAFGLRLGSWDKRFDQFPQPVGQEFDGLWTTPVRRDVPSLSTGCWRNVVLLDVIRLCQTAGAAAFPARVRCNPKKELGFLGGANSKKAEKPG